MSVCDAINYMHSMDIMHRDIKVILSLFSQKIFSWIIKIQLRYAISGLLLIASQE
jgi:serine/threonine protein kinase